MRVVLMGGLGVLLWLIAQVMGLGLTGAGHGWYGAFFFSLPLVVLYPLVFVRAVSSKAGPRDADVGILAAAIVLDLLLLGNIFSWDNGYFMQMWNFDSTFVMIWLALWAGWQVVFVATLLKKSLNRTGGESA